MKEKILLLAAIAATWAGCSTTETIDQPKGQAIDFTSAYIGNPVETKAVSVIEKANINEFVVYGGYNDMTHVFDGVSVTGTPNADDWTYSTTRYWVAGQEYKFAAYAPSAIQGNGTIATDFATGNLNFTGYTSDATHQHDLIYATTTKTTQDPLEQAPAKVQLRFSHLLSLIKFTFISGFGNDVTVTVKNLNVSGMISQGDYTGSTNSWTLGSATAAFTEIASATAVNKTSGQTKASSVDFAVLPQTIVAEGTAEGTKVTVSFDVTVQDNQNEYIVGSAEAGVGVSATLPAYTWLAGNRYNYNVTIAGENVDLFPIEFGTPDVTPITDAQFDGSDEVILPTN